jgi:hypothetical protein
VISFANFPVNWRFLFEWLSAPHDGIVARVPIRASIVPGAVAVSVLDRVHKTTSFGYPGLRMPELEGIKPCSSISTILQLFA